MSESTRKPLFAGILDRGAPLARVPDYRTIIAASKTTPALVYNDKKGAPWYIYDMGSSGWYGDGHERYPPPLKEVPTSFWDIFLPSDQAGLYAGSWTELKAKIDTYSSLHTPLEPKPGTPKVPVPPDPTKTTPPTTLPDVTKTYPTTDKGRYTLANNVVIGVSPSHTIAARQIETAIGEFESGFGIIPGWFYTDPKTGLSVPSWNWGGIMAFGDTPGFSHGDKDKDGKPIAAKFRTYSDMIAGYKGFLATWNRPDTLSFAQDGDAWGVAEAMYAHGYYGGTAGSARDRVKAYANAIHSTAAKIAKVLGEDLAVKYEEPKIGEPPKAPPGTPAAGGAGPGTVALYAVGGAALGYGLYRAFT